LAGLERAVPVLVPGQEMAGLRSHAQRLFPGKAAVSELPVPAIVPARDRLPCRPQHRIGHPVGRKGDRHAAIEHAPNRDALLAELTEPIAIACHPQKTRHDRSDDAKCLHALDLRITCLIDMDDHPATVANWHFLVDRLIGAERVFEIAAYHAVYTQPQPSGFDAELHEPLLRHCLVEVPRPLIVWIAGGDNVCHGAVGMAAEIDSLNAQEIVADSVAARYRRVMMEEIEQPFV